MKVFVANLRGAEEVPPVRTRASGQATFRLSKDGRRLRFILIVRNLRRATQGHIHIGRRGQNGPVVVFLFGPLSRPVSTRRSVVTGTITANDLVGPLEGQRLSRLIQEMKRGNTYVNVHTVRNPEGEIRGQVQRVRHRQVRSDSRLCP